MTEHLVDPATMPVAEQAERRMLPPDAYREVGHSAVDSFEISANHELLESKHLVTPQAALLELTSFKNQTGVMLQKLDKEVGSPAEVLATVDTLEPPTAEKRQEASDAAIALLKSAGLHIPTPPVPAGSVGKEAYDSTQRDRKMFGVGKTGGSANGESYMSQLFAGATNPEIVERVTGSLNHKRILNLGGGNARLTQELTEHGAENTEVLNVEPYPSDEAVEGEGFDHIIEENPAQADFFEKTDMPEGSVDEIWAVFSVPAYLGTAAEVTSLFDNVKRAIKPGGVIRMSHFGVAEADGGDSFATRSDTVLDNLESAKQEGYLLEVVTSHNGTKTLIMTAPDGGETA